MKKTSANYSTKKSSQASDRIEPNFENFLERLKQSQIQLTQRQYEQLWVFHRYLRKRNLDRDLTRIIGFENMVSKHYVDCLIAEKFYQIPEQARCLDVGSGAGFPGLILKLQYPQSQWILAERRPNRVAFLQECIQQLKFTQIEVFGHQLTRENFLKQVDLITCRAFDSIPSFINLTFAYLKIGGVYLFYKGPEGTQELEDLKNKNWFIKNFEVLVDQNYILPLIEHDRKLIVLRKINDVWETKV